jgi:hypothetical protein
VIRVIAFPVMVLAGGHHCGNFSGLARSDRTEVGGKGMKRIGYLAMLAAVLSLAQDATVPAQLTQVPPKPTCVVILRNGACADLWQTYNQALAQRTREELQLYVNRQKELASSQATAPLQQLITDQQAQIKKLQEQIEADSAAALQAQAAAHRQGLQYGTGVGAGAVLLIFGLVFGIRKFAQNFSVTKKPQSHPASV